MVIGCLGHMDHGKTTLMAAISARLAHKNPECNDPKKWNAKLRYLRAFTGFGKENMGDEGEG